MMKIFKSLAIITAVVAIAGGGTYAFLTNTKKASNVTMGSMPFEFDATFTEDGGTIQFLQLADRSLGDVAPGDGDISTLAVDNKSYYNGTLSMKIAIKGNNENSITAQEQGFDNDSSGELCESVKIRVYVPGVSDTGFFSLSDFGTRNLGTVNAHSAKDYTIEYEVPTTVTNEILTDTCVFDAELVLTQQEGFVPKS